MRRGGAAALAEVSRFFMGHDPVHHALRKIARRLEELDTPYAVAGGMALVAHGYVRATVDVDILVTEEGLRALHERLEGLGYRPVFPGGRQLRDTEHGVQIEFLVTGEYPGDGKPKPVRFPDPATSAVERDGIRYLSLQTLVELKLASGLSHPGRLRDLADVQELIRVLDLPAALADQLDPSVREKYIELWRGLRRDDVSR